jgi:methionyl-tRNA formyltransferase
VIDARIRAFTPWPLSWTTHKQEKLFILEARPFSDADGAAQAACAGTVLGADKQAGILVQTGKGVLAVTKLQYQAKKALGWKDFLNGSREVRGAVLGNKE